LEQINIAIIGKPNVGKSTLFNALLGTKRAITSSIAGTTRDSLDVELFKDEQKYLLVDTAGLRKKTKISDKVERYSTIRALNSLSAADVVLMVIDAVDGPQEQDTKILGLAHEHGVGIVICINKWDLIKKNYKTVKEYTDKVYDTFKFARYAPLVFMSAISGRRCSKVLGVARDVAIQRRRRIPTGQLNRVLKFAHSKATAPTYRGHLLKFYFGAQITTCPPRFALFFNFTKGIHFSYLRSLKNTIRDKFGFTGTDIKLVLKKR
jgi:GTP-binding protein